MTLLVAGFYSRATMLGRRLDSWHAARGAVALLVTLSLAPEGARAEPPDGELRLMNEPIDYTDVPDAFEEGDPFDLELTARFDYTSIGGTIQREVTDGLDAVGGRQSEAFRDVAEWTWSRSVLDLGVSAGLYHDVAIYLGLPLVLSDARQLRYPGGRTRGEVDADLTVQPPGGTAAPLFSPQFDSPTRAGIDYLRAGLALGIFNQYRDPHLPTWVLRIEGRFNVSPEMVACRQGDSGTECLQPDGSGGLSVMPGGDPGVGRGTNALRVETRVSRRFRYIEPYMGIGFQVEWPGKASEFFTPGGSLSGYINTIPPILGELTAGVAIVPWEHRGQWQRLSIDLRFLGAYVSEGREYSPLFDALGTSRSPYLAEPNLEGIPDGSRRLREVEFTGLTDVQSHGRIGGSVAVDFRAAQEVSFRGGFSLTYDTPYFLTYADACNPNEDPQGPDDPRKGRCRSGIINPHHRTAIDLPGNRFRLDGAWQWGLSIGAVARF